MVLILFFIRLKKNNEYSLKYVVLIYDTVYYTAILEKNNSREYVNA